MYKLFAFIQVVCLVINIIDIADIFGVWDSRADITGCMNVCVFVCVCHEFVTVTINIPIPIRLKILMHIKQITNTSDINLGLNIMTYF